MQTITHTDLLTKLQTISGNMFVGIEAITDAKARKTDNPHGTIFKHIRAVGTVGADYQTSVNREAIRQGGLPVFQADSLPWGQWLIPGKVIEHGDKLYLRTQCTPGQRRKQPARVLDYRNEAGQFIARDKAQAFITPRKESAKQQGVTGINQTVWVSTYALDSIRKIRIGGQTYKLTK
jgi:hypothetical protein